MAKTQGGKGKGVVMYRTALYTIKGENHKTIKYKAVIYKKVFKRIRSCEVKIKKEKLREYIKPRGSIKKLIKSGDIEVTRAWNQVMDMFCHKDHSRYHDLLVRRKLNMLFCTEDELNAVVYRHIKKRATKLSYIRTFSTGIRNVFRAIGREMAYGDGEILTKNVGAVGQKDLINTGNPMTTKIKDDLMKEMKDDARHTGKKVSSEHHAPAISMPVAVCLIVKLMADLATMMVKKPIPDVLPRNKALLLMLYTVLIHEGGSRYTETANELEFKDLFFVLHRRVPMLALVFMAPETVDWVLRNNILTHYVLNMFKGKQKQESFMRFKAVIPYPYNLLDMPTLFVLVFKSIVFMQKGVLLNDKKLFSETKGALRMANKRFIDQTRVDRVTFYSFRYAAAEEDKVLDIPEHWTRKRMGHTDTSNTKDWYAKDNSRVLYNGVQIELADELGDDDDVKLEFRPVANVGGFVFDEAWMDKAFEGSPNGIREDFEKSVNLVCRFLEGDRIEAMDAKEEMQIKFCNDHRKLKSLKLPLGTRITLPEGRSTVEMQEDYLKDLNIVKEIYCGMEDEEGNASKIVEISNFPQIVYGNMRGLIAEDHVQLPMKVVEPQPKIWVIQDIEPEDYVVLRCSKKMNNDKCAFRFGSDTYLWIVRFDEWEFMDHSKDIYRLKGWFLWNAEKDILNGSDFKMKRKTETIQICEGDILDIYIDEVLTKLDENNIKSLKMRMGWVE